MNFGGLNILAGLIAGLDILRAAGQRTRCFHWQFSSSSLAAIPTSASVDSLKFRVQTGAVKKCANVSSG